MTYSIYCVYTCYLLALPCGPPGENVCSKSWGSRRAESMNDARVHEAGKTEAKSQDLTRYQGSEERGHCISWNGTHVKWALRTGRL